VKRMKRRQLFLSSAKAALATMFGSSWLFKQAKAPRRLGQAQAQNLRRASRWSAARL
jgi:hypothetical protein